MIVYLTKGKGVLHEIFFLHDSKYICMLLLEATTIFPKFCWVDKIGLYAKQMIIIMLSYYMIEFWNGNVFSETFVKCHLI